VTTDRWPRPRLGLLLRRRPQLWWLLVISVALMAGWLAANVVARAERTRAGWGATQAVVVVDRARRAGEALRPGDVAVVERPRAVVPADALGALPPDAVLRADVVAGEVLVARRLAPSGLSGVAAMLPPGTRAVAIPTEAGLVPPLAPGDRVDVLVALPAEAAGGGPPGFAVATAALVVAVDDAGVTVAVPRDVAPRVAVALGQGAVTLALVGA
jgi:Flp pilus assembly protein CpaB